MDKHLLTENDAAKLLRVSVAALRRWRVENRGPEYMKLHRLVRYSPEAIANWLDSRPGGGERLNPAENGNGVSV